MGNWGNKSEEMGKGLIWKGKAKMQENGQESLGKMWESFHSDIASRSTSLPLKKSASGCLLLCFRFHITGMATIVESSMLNTCLIIKKFPFE